MPPKPKQYKPDPKWLQPYMRKLYQLGKLYEREGALNTDILTVMEKEEDIPKPKTLAQISQLKSMIMEAKSDKYTSNDALDRALGDYLHELLGLERQIATFEQRLLENGINSKAAYDRLEAINEILLETEFDGLAETEKDMEMALVKTVLHNEKRGLSSEMSRVSLEDKHEDFEIGGDVESDENTESDEDNRPLVKPKVSKKKKTPIVSHDDEETDTETEDEDSSVRKQKSKTPVKKTSKKKPSKTKTTTKSPRLISKKDMNSFIKNELRDKETVTGKYIDQVNVLLQEWVANLARFFGMNSVEVRAKSPCEQTSISIASLIGALRFMTSEKFVAKVTRYMRKNKLDMPVNRIELSRIIQSVTKTEVRVEDEVLAFLSFAVVRRFKKIVQRSLEVMRKQNKLKLQGSNIE